MNYLNQFYAVVQKMHLFVLFGTNLHYICCEFSMIIEQITAESAPSKGANFDESSENHEPQSLKKKHS